MSNSQVLPEEDRPDLSSFPAYTSDWPPEEVAKLQKIEGRLLPLHQKWGFLVYRTTYSDDEKWDQFIKLFQEGVRKDVKRLWGDTEHVNYLDFPVQEDSISLKDATKDELRNRFDAWRTSNEPWNEQGLTKETNPEFLLEDHSLRTRYFIQVDDDAMESVLAYGTGINNGGYVNLIWSNAVYKVDEEDTEDVETDLGHPELEGMNYLHVGFQRVAVEWIYPHFWWFFCSMDENDDLVYDRPPIISGNSRTGYFRY
jgi:hypothetical protein